MMQESTFHTNNPYTDSLILKREAQGDMELLQAIIAREIALDTYIEQRHEVIDPTDLADKYFYASYLVEKIKIFKGILEPEHVLESSD